ncbi:HEAT repeat domain-containing protein [Methyloglobulus sp.]|uniref:HEAT repeat domain-containing protein n=1 Tax=Methyloglobulus sp. TaxID=2518622 RepID=UPI0032B84165
MRTLHSTNIFLCIALIVAFLLGFYIRDNWFGQHVAQPIKNVEAKPLPNDGINTKRQETQQIAAINPDIAKLIQENAYLTANCNSATTLVEGLVQPNLSAPSKPASELLTTLEFLSAQKKTVDDLQASAEFQQLMALMQADPAATKLVMERFLEVAGTPLGDMLSSALLASGGAFDAQAVAVQLLRDGTPQQRVGALSMLGQVGGTQDAQTRAMVLDILQNDSGANTKLAVAALSTLNRVGDVISLTEQQDVVETITPLLHAQDPQLRETSLLMLSQWAGHDEAALQTFTEAANDTNQAVKVAAISALGGFSFEDVRDTLLSKIQNPNENFDVKNAAQAVLGTFPLDDQALKVYKEFDPNSSPDENPDGTWHQTIVRDADTTKL